MTYPSNKKVICDACGKTAPGSEIRRLRMKTCCSYRLVPVCKKCWNKLHKK